MAIFVVDRTVSHADFISAMARSHFLRCEAKSDASFIIVSLRWLLVRWKLRSPMPVACRILSVGGSRKQRVCEWFVPVGRASEADTYFSATRRSPTPILLLVPSIETISRVCAWACPARWIQGTRFAWTLQ